MDKNKVWNAVLERLSGKISRMELQTWFQKVRIHEIAGGCVLISCPTEMNKNWLETKYSNVIKANFQTIMPEIDKVYFNVDLSLADSNSTHPDFFEKPKAPRKLPNQPEVKMADGMKSRIVQSHFTLQNFVVGPENNFAHAACVAISEIKTNEPKKYNPLYVYGGVGLGKTHLLQGTANEIIRRNPEAVVVYTTAERFTNEMVKSIKNKKTEEMRKKYRKADVLLIDDVQFFGGKERTQVELFNTFNDLKDLNKQMIFSADRPPAQLEDVMDRLTSRLEWGLTVDVQMPSFETKLAIIQTKSQEIGLIIPDDVQQFMATNIRKSLRELESILNKVEMEIEVTGISPTVQTVGKIFRELHPDEDLLTSDKGKKGLAKNTDDIITVVSDYFQIPATDLLGTSRKKEIVFPRQICWVLCKKILKMSYEAIGYDFGGKNHTTIMHGISKIEKLARKDTQTARHLHALKKDLGVK